MQLPNYTQVANDFIDRVMRECTGNEVKVGLVIFRKTIGWHKLTDAVPFSQIRDMTGITDNRTIKNALEGLEAKGVLHVNRGGKKPSGHWEGWTYDLNIEEQPATITTPETPGVTTTPEPRWNDYTGEGASPGVTITPSERKAFKESSSKESEDALLAEINRLQKIKPMNGFLANAKAAVELGNGLTENQQTTLATMSRENPGKGVAKEKPVPWQPSKDMQERTAYMQSEQREESAKYLDEIHELTGTHSMLELAAWERKHGVKIDYEDLGGTVARIREHLAKRDAIKWPTAETEPVEIF